MPHRRLGRVPHFDIRNNLFPARSVIHAAGVQTLAQPKSRKWRQWMTWYQADTPECTLFSALTDLSAAPVTQPAKLMRALIARFSTESLFQKIREEDIRHGRDYGSNGGATVLAAAQVGVDMKWWSSFAWSYNTDESLRVLSHISPVIYGTDWVESMFFRDSEGIARIKPGSPTVGGHAWCANAYDAKRGLVRYESTWNDGPYWIPDGDVADLLERRGGECMIPSEIKLEPLAAMP